MPKQETIRTRDGQNLTALAYLPEIPNGSVVLLAGSAGHTQLFYEKFAWHLCQLGFKVITFDYRGVGLSRPSSLKGFRATLQEWAKLDLDAIILCLKHHHPKDELIFIGHGISGQIAGMAPASQFFDKMILVNSALSCRRFFLWKHQLLLAWMKVVRPVLSKIYGYFPGSRFGLFQDLPAGIAEEWTDWCSRPNGLFDVLPDTNYRKLRTPLLAYSFSDDWLAPLPAMTTFLTCFPKATVTWKHIEPPQIGMEKVGHSGFFDQKSEVVLWKGMCEWLGILQPADSV